MRNAEIDWLPPQFNTHNCEAQPRTKPNNLAPVILLVRSITVLITEFSNGMVDMRSMQRLSQPRIDLDGKAGRPNSKESIPLHVAFMSRGAAVTF
jgi:hypothetical protein